MLFRPKGNSLFFMECSGILFSGCIEKTFHETYVYYSKHQLKQEANSVSGHQSRLKLTSLKKYIFISKFSVGICHTISIFLFNSSAISCTFNLQSKCTKVHPLFTFAFYFLNFWLTTSCIIVHISHPSLNYICHT